MTSTRRRLVATLLAATATPAGAQVELTASAVLQPSDGASGDRFGAALDLSSGTAVVGSPLHDQGAGVDSGAAYVFVHGGTSWTEQVKLRGDGDDGDELGTSVAIDGDTVVCGAPLDDEVATDAGAAYVFTRVGTDWSLEARLVAAGGLAFDRFGTAVGVSGDTLAVSAPGHGGSGSTYVHVRSGTTWTLEAHLLRGSRALDLDGDRLVTGGRVFERTGTTWAETAIVPGLSHSSPCALDGEQLVFGNPEEDAQGVVNSGAAHVFRLGPAGWDEEDSLVHVAPQFLDELGRSVDLDGGRAVGTANQNDSVVFLRGGPSWSAGMLLLDTPGVGAKSVALDGGTCLVGRALGGEVYAFDVPAGDPGTAACFGDGGATTCPCGNDAGHPGEGCVHSGGEGMSIAGFGSASIAADDLTLVAAQCPRHNSGIFYGGETSLDPGLPLYDGLQCASGNVRRFRGNFQSNGIADDTGFVAQDPSGVYFVPGITVHYQYWTRDVTAGTSPCGTSANLSPAYAVTYVP